MKTKIEVGFKSGKLTVVEKTAERLISSNKSGYNGVYQNKRGKWIAQITFKSKTYYLGTYIRIEDAVKKCMMSLLSGIIMST